MYESIETPDGTVEYVTTLTLDVQGNVLVVTDARGNDIQVQAYDLLGRPGFTGAADEGYDGSSGKGESRVFPDVAGTPIRAWRSGDLTVRSTFDALRRPVGVYVDEGSGERLVAQTVYGDTLSTPPAFSLGRPVQSDDTAGRVTLAYDFRGRTTSQARQVFTDITHEADWSAGSAAQLDAETFTVTTAYDALNRVTEQTAPDASRTVPGYDAGGRLTTVDVHIRGSTTATPLVTEITYDARGQRLSIAYGNGVDTTYTYDPQRLWLIRLLTTGPATLQDLSYTRDAVGNLLGITDDAQETTFFSNAQVTPDRTFTYDALYRLTQATGREKAAQSQTTAFYTSYAGATGAIPDLGNPALRQYTQSYTYDPAGNILEMKHQQGLGGSVLWRRGYAYAIGNNQLQSTSLPGDDPDDPATHSDAYDYNDRGAMTSLPHLKAAVANLTRDFRDQIRRAELDSAGNVAWYAYDAGGIRVRKLWDKGSVKEERIYVGGYEIWRQRNGSGMVQEERQTVHVLDDQRRIAMIETLTVTGGSSVATPTPRQRYQLDDHLGTALLEVDETGAVISYEEFHPYGTTAWYAEKSGIQVSAKRYRYTGKEKDEETGLHYHDARYYAPWLGRWERPDPAAIADGANCWSYVGSNPIRAVDRDGRAEVLTEDQSAFNEIVLEQGGNMPQALVVSFVGERISGSTPQDRLDALLALTSNGAYTQFNEQTVRGTGDKGFRLEFRDSVRYNPGPAGRDVPLHRSSSNQLGHFLTAANIGARIQRNQKAIESLMGPVPVEGAAIGILPYEVMNSVLVRAMVGHELVPDFASSSIDSILAPTTDQVEAFQEGRLNEIDIKRSNEGNSYQDLYLTAVGARFGSKVVQGTFQTREDAARWLALMLTDETEPSTVTHDDPLFAEATWLGSMLEQFRTTQPVTSR